MISAGEASGDRHAAALVRHLTGMAPNLSFFGLGGPQMAEAGVELTAEAGQVSVTGLFEVIPSLGRIIRAQKALRRALAAERPRALILVDFPDFNFLLARAARRLDIPVIYYIVPQIWAWRRGRVKFLKKNVSRLIVILPFEEDWYRQRGLKTFYAGHPLADLPPLDPDHRTRFLAGLGLDPDRPVVGLLPGSRTNEIKRTMPLLAGAARLLLKQRPGLSFLLPMAPGRKPEELEGWLNGLPAVLVQGRAREVLAASRAALVCSGTATLEAALARTPLVMFYRISPWTYLLRSFVPMVDTFSLPNLIAGRRVVAELIQGQASPRNLAAEVLPLLDDGPRREEMLSSLAEIGTRVGGPGAARRAAGAILKTLTEAEPE